MPHSKMPKRWHGPVNAVSTVFLLLFLAQCGLPRPCESREDCAAGEICDASGQCQIANPECSDANGSDSSVCGESELPEDCPAENRLPDGSCLSVENAGEMTWLGSVSSPTTPGGNFGFALDGENGRLAISGRGEDGKGAVFVFQRAASDWNLEATLTPDFAGQVNGFGSRVQLSDEVIAVACTGTNLGGENRTGALFIYRRTRDGWSQTQVLVSGEHEDIGGYGDQIDLNRGLLAVAVPFVYDTPTTWKSEVWVYRDGPTGFDKEAMLGTANDLNFGFSDALAIEEDTLVIADANRFQSHIFKHGAEDWEHVQTLGDQGVDRGEIGRSLAMVGDDLLAGASRYGHPYNDGGKVYALEKNSVGLFSFKHTLLPAEATQEDRFGGGLAFWPPFFAVMATPTTDIDILPGTLWVYRQRDGAPLLMGKVVPEPSGTPGQTLPHSRHAFDIFDNLLAIGVFDNETGTVDLYQLE
jgi:hypothetical protein